MVARHGGPSQVAWELGSPWAVPQEAGRHRVPEVELSRSTRSLYSVVWTLFGTLLFSSFPVAYAVASAVEITPARTVEVRVEVASVPPADRIRLIV